MAKRHAFILALLLLVALINSAMAWTIHPKMHIHMINNLWPAPTLNIHCKSKDDDLGEQALSPKQEFHWSFKDNIAGTTLFWCAMNWKDNDGKTQDQSFDVYNSSILCTTDCWWSARVDGIYFYDENQRNFVRQYVWNAPN
ncbi:hypothetical protein Scep_007909 [Stephania cephalantha]|uniref:S-protein homolog n=1 Tax=Stephania cephalantha TaxID=152367 RepID=A0AAP0PM79_9MAGN